MSSPADAIKQAQQKAWATGDFSMVGGGSLLAGELLCEAVKLHAGERVLDVATGSGNTALAAARRRAEVVGVDFVPALLDRARERAQAERFKNVTFELGDAENLPFPDQSFDVVLSSFGHMFAPDPMRAANEMMRVCRASHAASPRGGRIGFVVWPPESFIGQFFQTVARFNPLPPGLPPPVLWGKAEVIRERFPLAKDLSFETRTLTMRAYTPESWLKNMLEYFGPLRVAFEKLNAGGRNALETDILALLKSGNRSGDPTLYLPADYLEAVVYL